MKTPDELISLLDLGGECSRRAWRLLAAEHRDTFSPKQIGTTGQDLDQLAYDLRRLGYHKPARMAYTIAFVLNGLAGDNIQFDDNLADKTLEIVSIMAEMLLELKAAKEITVQEPVEIVEQLKIDWGLVIYTENSTSNLPEPHFDPRRDETKVSSEQLPNGLARISDQMVDALESLMLRVQRIGDFPFSPTLSRIHHLAMSIRSHAIGISEPASQQKCEFEQATTMANSSTASANCAAAIEMATIDDLTANEPSFHPMNVTADNALTEVKIDAPPPHILIPNVLVIDDSPFFRMLLTSAVETCGYSIRAIAGLEEAEKTCGQIPWSMVVWGGCENSQNIHQLREWLSSTDATAASIVLLTLTGNDAGMSIPGCHQIRRTDISGLMSLMTKLLGDLRRESRKIA